MFWDSSAVIPLISEEPASPVVADLLRGDEEMSVWWGTWAECAVAISRLGREGRLGEEDEEESRATLDGLFHGEWMEIEPTDEVRLLAAYISRQHPLKAADALQLAAALRWCEGSTEDSAFVCLDNRLRSTARDEGFRILPEGVEL